SPASARFVQLSLQGVAASSNTPGRKTPAAPIPSGSAIHARVGRVMRLRQLRTGCGLTQEQLAAQLGVTARAIARWESGKNPIPTKYLRPLAFLLGTSVTELVAPREDE